MTDKTYNNGPPEPGAWQEALKADPRVTLVTSELEQLFASVSQVSVGVASVVDKSGTILANIQIMRSQLDQLHGRFLTDEKDMIAGLLRALSGMLANDNRHGSEWLLNASVQFKTCALWTRDLLQKVQADLELDRP